MPNTQSLNTQFYTWKGYRCAYEVQNQKNLDSPTSVSQESRPQNSTEADPLVLIHPIGVGLARQFWARFCQGWQQQGQSQVLYLPDFLGCGESDMPAVAYRSEDWAKQLLYFLTAVVKRPSVLVVQGALFPVAIALAQIPEAKQWIKGFVLSGPPAWAVMTTPTTSWQIRLLWNLLFEPPVGPLFYRYARRRAFLESFSVKQLFGDSQDVDTDWLDMLEQGAVNPASRYAVFSFLAGFWRQDYAERLRKLEIPTLVTVGESASSISRSGKTETPQERVALYLQHLPQAQGKIIAGRNVMPYEATTAFIEAIAPFCLEL
ncbi:MAG: alpha/beta hydrolase [Cyanobacteria bacterium P01_F01_bin.150]